MRTQLPTIASRFTALLGAVLLALSLGGVRAELTERVATLADLAGEVWLEAPSDAESDGEAEHADDEEDSEDSQAEALDHATALASHRLEPGHRFEQPALASQVQGAGAVSDAHRARGPPRG